MALVELLPGSPDGRRRLQLQSPATLEPIGAIEVATADEVRAAVEDWAPMQSRMEEVLKDLDRNPPPTPADERAEDRADPLGRDCRTLCREVIEWRDLAR